MFKYSADTVSLHTVLVEIHIMDRLHILQAVLNDLNFIGG